MSGLNESESIIQEPLPKYMEKNGMTYTLDEKSQVYYPDIEEGEDLGMYAVMLAKGLQEHNPIKMNRLMARGEYFDYLEESNEICFKIAEDYMDSVTEPEPADFMERVQWNERHSMRGKELAMEELNRRITSPYKTE